MQRTIKKIENKQRNVSFLKESSNLIFSHCGELENLRCECFDSLLYDIFEVKNLGDTETSYLFLPNGRTEMIFNIYPRGANNYLRGPVTFARTIAIPAGGSIFCVRFKPEKLEWLVKQSAFHLADRVEPLENYLVDFDYIFSKLKETSLFQRHCEIILDYFEKRGHKITLVTQ